MRKWLPVVPIAAAVAFTAAEYSRLPAVVRPEWERILPIAADDEGMSRLGFAVMMPLIALAIWAAFAVGARIRGRPNGILPEHLGAKAVERFEPTYHMVVLAVVGLIALFHLALLATVVAWPDWALKAIGATLGLGLLFIGNVMPRVRPNWIVGVRTRGTVNDPEVWTRTHRYFGAFMMIAGAAVIIVAVVAVRYVFPAFAVGILVAAALSHWRGRARRGSTSTTVTAML